MKTVTYKGRTYEIGKYYLFGSVETGQRFAKLVDVWYNCEYPFRILGNCFREIRRLPIDSMVELGAIKPTLVDGAYIFSYCGEEVIALYFQSTDRFHHGSIIYDPDSCTNIRRLVEEK